MKKAIVLVMHGMSPKDFPPAEKKEFMRLRGLADPSRPNFDAAAKKQLEELEIKIRRWPRTAQNDPFFTASVKLAGELKKMAGCDVLVGFNEFCDPTVEEAIEKAVRSGASEITVITPMLTPGGHHSEIEIPAVVRAAKSKHPAVAFHYAWPFPIEKIAAFLAEQIGSFQSSKA